MQIDAKDQVYAGFFVRLAAFLVDMIIVNAGLVVVRFPMWIWQMDHAENILFQKMIFQYSLKDILIYGLTITYFVLLTYYTGSTLGKKLFALRVVCAEDREMTFFEVLYRETIGRFLADVVFCLGYLFIIVQKEHRGLHDLLSDTCVIYYHEKKVYVHTQMNYRNMAPQPGFTVPPDQEKRASGTGNGNAPGMDGNGFREGGNTAPEGKNTLGEMIYAMPSDENAPAEDRDDISAGESSSVTGRDASFVRESASTGGGQDIQFTSAPNRQGEVDSPAGQNRKPYVSEGYFSFDDQKKEEDDTPDTL